MGLKHSCKRTRRTLRPSFVAVFYVYIYNASQRSVTKVTPLAHLRLIHSAVVALHSLRHHRKLGLARLQHDKTALAAPAGTSRHLRHHLESPLVCPEVGDVEHLVGIDNPHHPHAVEVQAFRHHLRAYQEIGAPALEIVYYALVSRARARGVQVHTRRACLGKHRPRRLFYFFRAVAHIAQIGIGAVGALARHVVHRAAIVADELSHPPVIGKRNVALGTARRPPAGAAFEHGRVAAAVLEENGLPARSERTPHLLDKARGERRLHQLFPPQLLHVLHHYLRQLHAAVPLRHLYQRITSALGVVVALQRRGCRAQKHLCARHAPQDDGGVTGVVARGRVLLLVACLMLLVDHYQPQVAERQEKRRAHAEDEGKGPLRELPPPQFGALRVRKLGMVHPHTVAEDTAETGGYLRGEGYLRQ